ncbi:MULTISPECIES: MOSC and FAD-binding oxidoreductase domain-containing protein [unclassified Mycobacterium]|uniref:MOSC and FAD-binding oxidoreductase domain-containing protein n=1 Tax=unclassified Mycobacterium TaxID=2642494 RepID=UPI0007FE82F7|nr:MULTISPECIES: MOSC and FAD-binding oxidoreductase domain-containing protein [unclassified Mycobacterium]OBB48163.1 sulfurase [Mycobacterium sp. 852002-51961_SCH5331710]OBH00042.1 sulfurase [Mycobacterium sp. E136]
MPTLHAVNVGLPRDVPWRGRTVHTGIFKTTVSGPVVARRLNLDGDGQGDLHGHGGENRAVLVYQIEAYDHWKSHLGRDDLRAGAFGENFTVSGLPDDEVCIGDRYRIGEALFEVTQPRVTCFRVGMRLDEPNLPQLMVSHGRPGFYLRVLHEGRVQAGDDIVLTERGRNQLTVAEVDALLYLPDRDPDRLRLALDVAALSPGWKESFRDLLDPPVEPTGAPSWDGFMPLRVVDVHHETPAVMSIELGADKPLPVAKAGDHLVVRATGAGDPPPLRSYSLSGDSTAGTYRISVKREPGGVVSGWLHERIGPGATIDAAAPRGDFHLSPEARPILLMSAGIGVTPLLAMLYELAAQAFSQRIVWIHSARDRESHAFIEEAAGLLRQLPRAEQYVHYTGGRPGRRLDRDFLAALDLPQDADVYLCGPTGFMAAMREALTNVGFEPARIRAETFGTLPPINPGLKAVGPPVPPHPPEMQSADGSRVTFSRVGLTVRWSESYQTLLELAEACDVPTRYSCRSGVCHVCVTGLVAGSVAYPRQPLELPGRDSTLICCAAPLTDVVLDL